MNERVSECIRVKYQRGVRRKGASRASGSARYSWAWLGFGRAGLTLGRPEIIAKLSRDRLDFGALDGNACGSKAKYIKTRTT